MKMISVRHKIRLDSRWNNYATFFAGMAIFLLCVYFFGFKDYTQLNKGLFGSLWMPLLILGGCGVLMCGARVKLALPYGIAGVLYCVYMIGYTVAFGGTGPILAVLWYILAACAVMAAAVGVFPGKFLTVVLFALPVAQRLSAFAGAFFAAKDYVGFLPEAASLFGLLAFSAMGGAFERPSVSISGKQ